MPDWCGHRCTYLVAGESGNTFGTEVESAVGPDVDMVVLFGSGNDAGTDPEELREAAASTFAAASLRFIDTIADQCLTDRADVQLGPDGEHASVRGRSSCGTR